MLLAGALHGMTQGSIFELYATPEDVVGSNRPTSPRRRANRSAGFRWNESMDRHARRVLSPGKIAEPVARALPREFKSGFAVERLHARDDFDLRIKVTVAGDVSVGLSLADPQMPAAVREAVQTARRQNESDWLALVENDKPADLILKIDGSRAALFLARGSRCCQVTVIGASRPIHFEADGGRLIFHRPTSSPSCNRRYAT